MDAGSSPSLELPQQFRQFTISEIQLATHNFDESLVIGHGGFGMVYKGTITNGANSLVAAIKRLDSTSNQGAVEFWNEVHMLSKLRHCHLVSLIGYCKDGQEMILVYEYIPGGTLEDHLHKLQRPLPWIRRLKICIGAARGLDYLHTGTGIMYGIIHHDVKSSNILLDDNWAAKISDFGLSKEGPINQPATPVNTLVKGTFGYIDPNYYATGRLTIKSDVYAFGVVLFEVLSGKRAVDSSLDDEHWGLVNWVQESKKEGRLKQIIDYTIREKILPKCFNEFAEVAYRCLHSIPKQRPTMTEVVFRLESVLALQEKANNTLQYSGFGRIFGNKMSMFLSTVIGDKSGHVIIRVTKSGNDVGTQNSSKVSSVTPTPHTEGENDSGVITKSGNDVGSQNSSKVSSVPPTPRTEGEILQASKLKSFTFSDLKTATRNFRPDSVLGEGGFGSVFKGWIDEHTFAATKPGTGLVIAVKKLNQESFQGQREWLAEVNYLGQISHPNIVKLIGYCLEDEQRLLVYEFMSRGSLENHLFRRGFYFQPMSWSVRLKVAIGAARALAFLHDAKTNVIYRDFKTSNVLLDSNYNAKLSDFGLARDGPVGDKSHVSTRIMGTYGYAAPEYLATGHMTSKSDVYNFGVVLLELLSSRKALDKIRPSRESNLVEWAKPYLANKRELFRVMDIRLDGQYPLKGVHAVATIVLRCLSAEPKLRPNMVEVVKELKQLQNPKGSRPKRHSTHTALPN